MSSSVSRLSSLFKSKRTSKPIPKSTSPTPKSLIKSLFQEPDLTKLVTKFKQCSEIPSFRSNDTIYKRIIYRLSQAKQQTLIQDLLEHQTNYDDIKREGFSIRLISLYGKAGMPDHARKLFDEMPERKCTRTLKSFNALIKAYVHAKEYELAEKLFRELSLIYKLKPDDISYNVIIHCLCANGEIERAQSMVDEMEKNGVKPDVFTLNILTNWFYSTGRFEDGERVWRKLEESGIEPNVVSYNGKLRGLLIAGKILEVGKVFEEMKRRDVKLTVRTYNILLKWYCDAGLFEEAKGVFERLKNSDCVPDRVSYHGMIPCSCVKGDLDFAFELSKECLKTCIIDPAVLQSVVDLLVKDSRVAEAEELVKLGCKQKYSNLLLKMPKTPSLI